VALLALAGLTVLTVICAKPELIGANGARVCYGQSMEPTFKLGDMLISKSVDPAQVRIGDIIFYRLEGRILAHRVVEESDDNFRTKGDANEDPDDWVVPGRAVLGRYWIRLPYFGYIVHFIKCRHFSLFCIVVGSYLIASSTWDIYRILAEARKATVKAARKVKREYDRLVAFIRAWEWRWAWWRRVLGLTRPVCACGVGLDPRYQRYCVNCGEKVER